MACRIIKWREGDPEGEGFKPVRKARPPRELKRSEDRLGFPASEADLKLIVDSTPGLMWSALPDGRNEWANGHYLEYVGLSHGQLRGWGWTDLIHPDDLDRLMIALDSTLSSPDDRQAEARLRRHDGEYRWFLFSANAAVDEGGNVVRWHGMSTDIEARKRAEEELRRREALLAKGQHLAQIGNFSWRVGTGEITWSEPLYRIFEFELAIPVTLDLIAARVHPEDIQLMSDMIGRVHRGEADFEYEHRIVMPDSSIKWLHLDAHRVQGTSTEVEYVGAVLDVTQRHLSQAALNSARSELAHVTRVMSLGTLAASIAHEINQPLSGIITNAGTCLRMLAGDQPNVEGALETARRTIRDGHRAADVVTRLRALFSKRPASIEPIDINHAALEVIALLRSDLCMGRVVLKTELADQLPLVAGDLVQLQQVIMNLVRNATDAMCGIEERPRLLEIRTELDDRNHVRFIVKDSGAGIQADESARIFEAFYTTKNEGMGMGLSISRAIIENHHGTLTAASNDGPGASFMVSIPASREGIAANSA
jgi:PAS domain S-box-containing protein